MATAIILASSQRPTARMRTSAADQAAAICVRIGSDRAIEILLISSRGTGRWILPKGYIERREPSYRAAQREACEEAGISGKIRKKPAGFYSYLKDKEVVLNVAVHVLMVSEETAYFKESGHRRKRWFSPLIAAEHVDEPELKAILAPLDAGKLLVSQDKQRLAPLSGSTHYEPIYPSLL